MMAKTILETEKTHIYQISFQRDKSNKPLSVEGKFSKYALVKREAH